MSTVMVPANATEALGMLECAAGFLADLDAPGLPTEAVAECLRGMERADAVLAAARGQLLAAFDTKDGAGRRPRRSRPGRLSRRRPARSGSAPCRWRRPPPCCSPAI